MPAFDVTASPTKLTLKPGETGTVIVTVTNRLGRSVMARADKVVEPASATAWVAAPPDPQRTFSDQPRATQDFRYQVTIPPKTPGTSFTFSVVVVEVGATDDNFGEGTPVTVTVPAEAVAPPVVKPGIPVWVWPVVAIVVIGVGLGLYFMLKGGGGMPNVVEKQYDAAESELQQKNMVVLRVDSLSAAADTSRFAFGAVMAQTPAAEAKLGANKDVPDTARLVVQKDFTVVPADLVNIQPLAAANKLGPAGLFTSVKFEASDSARAASGLIIKTLPVSGALAVRGDSVSVFVGSFSRPCHGRGCWILEVQPIRVINDQVKVRHRIPINP